MPTPAFARRARELCDATGAALIIDDVRAGFRLHLGGSWEGLGVRPDLAAWSKSIANGHPLAAITGNDRFRDAVMPRMPFRRWGTPQDFEAVAVWLASSGSSYFTGQTLVIDGGYTVF